MTTTYTIHGAGFIPGVPGIYANATVVVDNTGNVVSVNGIPQAPTPVAGPAISPYSGNPSQTAASGADTQYKFGTAGTDSFVYISGQNNSAVNVYLAFDQSTTIITDEIYTIAPGQAFAFDRAGTVLHFSSPSQVTFGSQAGLTIEAFA